MKYFLSLMILFLTAQLIGQPYLNETSRWKQYYSYSVYPPGVTFIEDVVLQLDGDTIIEGKTYYKVLKTGLDTTDYLNGSGDSNGTVYEYMNPIREGELGIYAYNLQQNREYLLYDFSAEIGDTLKSGHCRRDTVISIDTLYLGDRPRKQFHLPSPYSGDISTLVEGIGSTLGFYWQVCNVITSPFRIRLQCFSQDGDYIQFDPTYDCNEWIVADEVLKENVFSIHPNPFTDEIIIHFTDAILQNTTVSILNLMGIKVFESNLSANNSVERIALPDLAAGIYIVTVRHAREITSQKMMKL